MKNKEKDTCEFEMDFKKSSIVTVLVYVMIT